MRWDAIHEVDLCLTFLCFEVGTNSCPCNTQQPQFEQRACLPCVRDCASWSRNSGDVHRQEAEGKSCFCAKWTRFCCAESASPHAKTELRLLARDDIGKQQVALKNQKQNSRLREKFFVQSVIDPRTQPTIDLGEEEDIGLLSERCPVCCSAGLEHDTLSGAVLQQ